MAKKRIDSYVDMDSVPVKNSKTEKYTSEDSFMLSDNYVERVIMNSPFESLSIYRPNEQNIGFGSYIMVKTLLPVPESKRPKIWHIYWAKPNSDSRNNDGYDRFGRYGIEIQMPYTYRARIDRIYVADEDTTALERVVLFPAEYIIITEAKLKEYISFGYAPMDTFFAAKEETLSLKLLEKSKSLCEEERHIIMALQLDGLTENQACQEYFLYSHDQGAPDTLMYVPSAELLTEIVNAFGEGR